MTRKIIIPVVTLFWLVANSCHHASYVIPESQRTGDPSLCFERDILPIFLSECAKSGCHDAAEGERGYVLDSYENIVRKGIAPGNPIGSKIYRSVLGYGEHRMPMKAPPLTIEKIALLEKWIRAGAIKDTNCHSPCDSGNYAFSKGVQPLIKKYCVGCHSGSAPQGNLVLTGYDAVKSAVQNRNLLPAINHQPGYQPMPGSGLKLSACEIRQVEKWVEAGMPND